MSDGHQYHNDKRTILTCVPASCITGTNSKGAGGGQWHTDHLLTDSSENNTVITPPSDQRYIHMSPETILLFSFHKNTILKKLRIIPVRQAVQGKFQESGHQKPLPGTSLNIPCMSRLSTKFRINGRLHSGQNVMKFSVFISAFGTGKGSHWLSSDIRTVQSTGYDNF